MSSIALHRCVGHYPIGLQQGAEEEDAPALCEACTGVGRSPMASAVFLPFHVTASKDCGTEQGIDPAD